MEDIKATEEKKETQLGYPLKTILGEKVGMTRIFSEAGESIPVSVIFTGTCVTTDVKTKDKHGYDAVQMGAGTIREKSLSRPYRVDFEKRNLSPVRWLREFRVGDAKKIEVLREKIGQKVPVDVFSPGDYVDVSGLSKGKGFAGVMKRYNFRGLPASHGASDKERSRGSSGGGSGDPQRVWKGTRMAGRMGGDWVTVMKLEVVKVDKENDLLLVRGAVPGVAERMVVVRETSRALKHVRAPIVTKSAKKVAIRKPTKPAAKGKA